MRFFTSRLFSPIPAALALALIAPAATALEDADIPAHAPQDALMAAPDEIQAMQDWASAAFTGHKPAGRQPAIQVELRRQDHSVLGFGQSCIDTPIRLGKREFKHELGTHANSEIILHLPPDSVEFRAFAGIDNNADTGGVRGSVQFSVELGGKELYRTPTLYGSSAPVEIKIPLPEGTRQLTLKVDTTPDGPSYDQADWADACVATRDGTIHWADEDRQPFIATTIPFSFRYGGVPSSSLLKDWSSDSLMVETSNFVFSGLTWSDPKTSLRVTAVVFTFNSYPAVEWVLEFENSGTNETALIEDIQPLDAQLRTGYFRKPVVLHHLVGDVCGERSFLPVDTECEPGKTVVLAPDGGRASNGAFPFLNVQYGDEGMIAAIGWSGQWGASLDRSAVGPTSLRAGMEKTRLRLKPGESIRTPSILVMPWKGDLLAAQNRFRRLLLFEYTPHHNGKPLRLPVALQCFDRYVGSRPDWGTEAMQKQIARAGHDLGCDTHWLDAAWFEGGFPNGVGNWLCPTNRFPNGLKPVSDACHRMGLKFLVWFEPERVAAGTQIAREHPQFVFGGEKGGLFNLGNPEARGWLADLLSKRISEFGIDVYRNDFNIDPLGFWRAADSPEGQGLNEIRYVTGQYALWDTLLAQHPGLWIDDCASGGRRIDLETLKRSVPLWHSDTGCAPGHPDWNQTQICGLSLYVPLFCACAWTPQAYDLRSAGTAGVICQFAVLDKDFSFDAARAALAEVKENQKYWYGDFYPLTEPLTGPGVLLAWQLHRSDLNSGIVLAFRRSECPYPVLQTALHGLNPSATYLVDFIDETYHAERKRLSGKDLMSDFQLRLPKRGTSLLVRYREKPRSPGLNKE